MEEEKKTIEQEQQLEEANGGKGPTIYSRDHGYVSTTSIFGQKKALQILSVDSPRKTVSQISSCNGTLFKIKV